MGIRIMNVEPGSVADRIGLRAEDILLEIGNEPVLDEIDYQALISSSTLHIKVQREEDILSFRAHKQDWEPLGITLDESAVLKPRACRNRCVFCFVEQMRPGMRPSLYVKDDDWRLSLMMGNYITLTNVDDDEFERILRRRVSPLYISVHATDPEIRSAMMRNPKADELMKRLTALKEHGLSFHSQVVLCPGMNDGNVLEQTVRDLISLHPAAESLAVVPVGLTRFRDHLPHIAPVDREKADEVLDLVERLQQEFMERYGTRFVFASDEFYILAGRPIPEEEAYEGYPQIENGVGMIRLLREDAMVESETFAGKMARPRHVVIPTGVSAAGEITDICKKYAPAGVEVTVVPITNHFFGETVTVTGLLTGQDLYRQLNELPCDEILISSVMLRENEDCFLDDMTVECLSESLGKPIKVSDNTGAGLIRSLFETEDQ